MEFNTLLVKENFSSRLAIAIDPSYLPKSGKKTPHIGYFWSGCAGATKRGLEMMGIAAIDTLSSRALHLETIQTPSTSELPDECNGLLGWYLKSIRERAEQLKKISNIVVADAFFSKRTFVEGLTSIDFHLVSRLQNNASLRYLYNNSSVTFAHH